MIPRSQEAVDCQLKQYDTDLVNNQLTDQVNAVGAKSDGNTCSDKGKKCFSCDQEGHFSGDGKCPVLDRACRLCVVIGHFRVKCPRARSVVVVAPHPDGIKVAKALMMEEEILGVGEVTVEEDISWSWKIARNKPWG